MPANDITTEVITALRLGLQSFQTAPPILAFSTGLSTESCQQLLDQSLIAGYLLLAPPVDKTSEAAAAGWWVNSAEGVWILKNTKNTNLLFLGTQSQVGGRMLIAARRAGFRNIHFIVPGRTEIRSASISKSIAKVVSTRLFVKLAPHRLFVRGLFLKEAYNKSIAKVFSTRLFVKLAPHRLFVKGLSYEDAYQRLFTDIGDSLRFDCHDFNEDAVLMIIGTLGPGGAERQMTNTIIGFANRGRWRLGVLCNDVSGSAGFNKGALESVGTKITALNQSDTLLGDDRVQRAIEQAEGYGFLEFEQLVQKILMYAAEMRRQKPGTVQIWMDYCNVLAGAAAVLVGVPRIILCGRSVAPDNFKLLQPFMKPGYEALLKLRPDIVFINNSIAGAEDYARWLARPESDFEVINNGFQFPDDDFNGRAGALRKQYAIPEHAKVVGTLIRFSEEKQPFLWLKTAQKVLLKRPDTYFIAFGTGPLLRKMKTKVRAKGLSDRIIFPGVTREAWVAFTMMDIFLLTSRFEGLPNVLIEAQAMGVPVVSPGAGGMTETYLEGKTGFTASTATATALATSVISLIDNDNLRHLAGQHAKEHVRQNFHIERMLDRTKKIYEKSLT